MSWQDVMITFAQVLMLIALTPLVKADTPRPPVQSSLVTGLGLLIMAGCFASQWWLMSAGLTISMAVVWLLMAWRSWRTGS